MARRHDAARTQDLPAMTLDRARQIGSRKAYVVYLDSMASSGVVDVEITGVETADGSDDEMTN